MTVREFTGTAAAAPPVATSSSPSRSTPNAVWGAKPRHHIHGTVNGMGVRGVIEVVGDGHGFTLGPAWLRGCGLTAGAPVTIHIKPEGPRRGDLADDIAAALDAKPRAADFFDLRATQRLRGHVRRG